MKPGQKALCQLFQLTSVARSYWEDALILEAFIDGYFEIVNYLIENGAAMEHFTVSLVFFPLKKRNFCQDKIFFKVIK